MFGIRGGIFDHAAEFRVGRRELFSVDGRRRARRTWRAGGLNLPSRGAHCRHYDDSQHRVKEDLFY